MSSARESVTFMEFIGLPGSGKSTLAHELFLQLRAGNMFVDEPLYRHQPSHQRWKQQIIRIGYAIGFTLYRPGMSAAWVRLVFRSRQESPGDFRAVLLNALYKSEVWRRSAASGRLCMMDDGLLHAVWCILYRARNPNVDFLPVLRVFYSSRFCRLVVVSVQVADQIVRSRLSSRGHGSRLENDVMQGQGLEKAQDALIKLERGTDVLISEQKTSNAQVIRVTNNGDLQNIVPGLYDEVIKTFGLPNPQEGI